MKELLSSFFPPRKTLPFLPPENSNGWVGLGWYILLKGTGPSFFGTSPFVFVLSLGSTQISMGIIGCVQERDATGDPTDSGREDWETLGNIRES